MTIGDTWKEIEHNIEQMYWIEDGVVERKFTPEEEGQYKCGDTLGAYTAMGTGEIVFQNLRTNEKLYLSFCFTEE